MIQRLGSPVEAEGRKFAGAGPRTFRSMTALGSRADGAEPSCRTLESPGSGSFHQLSEIAIVEQA